MKSFLSCCDIYGESNIRYEIAVSDVTCHACVERIRKAISSLVGVSIYDFKADYRARTCTLYIISDKDISWEEVEKALLKASEGTPHNYKIISFKKA
ncbi:MAG: heavy metal-associated domain-containing protein [Sulfolobales archaeon]